MQHYISTFVVFAEERSGLVDQYKRLEMRPVKIGRYGINVDANIVTSAPKAPANAGGDLLVVPEGALASL